MSRLETQLWWGEAPEGPKRSIKAADVHRTLTVARPMRAPSRGYGLDYGSARSPTVFV